MKSRRVARAGTALLLGVMALAAATASGGVAVAAGSAGQASVRPSVGVDAAAPPTSVVVLVDEAASVQESDRAGGERLRWLKLIAAALPPGTRLGVAAFAGAGRERWLVPPAPTSAARVATWRRLPITALAGLSDQPAAETWVVRQAATAAAGRTGPLRVVVLADDEPDPGERRFAPAYARALATAARALARAGDALVTIRVGDNPGPPRWPVLAGGDWPAAAPALLTWLGWRRLTLALPPRALVAAAERAGVAAGVFGPRAAVWIRPPRHPVVLWFGAPGRDLAVDLGLEPVALSVGAVGGPARRVAVPPLGGVRVVAGRGGGVRLVLGQTATLVAATGTDLGAAPGRAPGGVGAPAPAPSTLIAVARRVRRLLSLATAERATAAVAVDVILSAFALAALRRLRRRRAQSAPILCVEPLVAQGADAADGVRTALGRRARTLGPKGLPGVDLAVPTIEETPLVRLRWGPGGFSAEALGGHHLYGPDGVPRREIALAPGVWLRVGDVRLALVPERDAPATRTRAQAALPEARGGG